MKKTWVIIIVVIVLILLSLMGRYNKMVNFDEGVKTAWSQVENVYQRRLDLIPNLVATVKWFAAQESKVLTDVVEARASATQSNVNINDAESFAQFQQSQGEISSALSRLLVTVEAYPDLKSNQNFLELQAQLEGTENRIAVERKNFNEVVKVYNVYIRSFPSNLIAGLFGFTQANLFDAEEGAEEAPVVDFTANETPAVATEEVAEETAE